MACIVIDCGCQRTWRTSSIAYIDTSRAEESERDGQVTDRRNRHQLSSSMNVSDKRNRPAGWEEVRTAADFLDFYRGHYRA